MDAEEHKGLSLVNIVSGEETQEDKDVTQDASVDSETYISAVSETKKRHFVRELFEHKGCLVSKVIGDIKPSQLEGLIEIWERGNIDPAHNNVKEMKDEVRREFTDFIARHIILRRYGWLSAQIGVENANRVMQKNPVLTPIGTMEGDIDFLKRIGLSDRKIASRAGLLGKNAETLMANYQALQRLGLSDAKITSQPQLLGKNSNSVRENCQALKRIGLSDKKIALRAELLGRDPKTLRANYQHLIGLLGRNGYGDGRDGRRLILTQPNLLTRKQETIEATVQQLYSIGIDYHNDLILLGTTAQLKRKKMAWMLRELFDYRSILDGQKRDAISRLYEFVRDKPRLLAESISLLERKKGKLARLVHNYEFSAQL